VLLGRDYWSGLLEWLRRAALEAGTVSPKDIDLLHLTDDVDEAVRLVVAAENHVSPKRPE
jgi:predicted Rossmann-fold nucleotide-binding protein